MLTTHTGDISTREHPSVVLNALPTNCPPAGTPSIHKSDPTKKCRDCDACYLLQADYYLTVSTYGTKRAARYLCARCASSLIPLRGLDICQIAQWALYRAIADPLTIMRRYHAYKEGFCHLCRCWTLHVALVVNSEFGHYYICAACEPMFTEHKLAANCTLASTFALWYHALVSGDRLPRDVAYYICRVFVEAGGDWLAAADVIRPFCRKN